MATDKNITINFVPKGDKRLIQAFEGLANAQKKFNHQNKKGEKQLKGFALQQQRVNTGNKFLANSFSVIRSKMLLFNFAIGLGVTQLINFAKQAAKVESMARAFNTLSGGAEGSSIAMSKLQEATNGTMSQFDLFQQANNAMVLGVSKNSDEMAEMFDIAQRLGRALGRDTASSVESLITGIGRQSRLMLDNIGIIVKADEAYDSYAKKLGTTADKLSDADKKQAFLQATMESARAKVALLGHEVSSSQDSFDRLSASVANATVAIGDKFKGAISGVIDTFTNFNDEQKQNTVTAERNAEVLGFFGKAFQKVADIFGANKGMLRNTVEDLTEKEQELLATKIKQKEFLDKFYADRRQNEEFQAQMAEQQLAREQAIFEQMMSNQPKQIEFQDGITQRSKMVAQSQRLASEQFKDGLLSEEEAMESHKNRVKVIDATILQSKARSVSGMIGALGKLNQAAGGSSKASARMAQVSATIDALAGANKAFAQGGIFGFATGAAILASGMANVIQIEKNIGKFEQGGLVGGRRHSQGGTMIEAEQGEFVMSRTAVQAVGVEAMNRINQGGSSGAVNISFAGNVMSQDFIEDEAIPMIKEAIRRGADIGVS